MKRWVSGVFLVFFIFLIGFPGSGSCAGKEVVYGFDRDYPPYSFVEQESPTGFDIDLVRSIFRDKDVRLYVKPMDWETVQDQLLKDGVGLTSGMSVTEERREDYDFSDLPYTSLNARIFVKEQGGAKSMDDLKGKRVAAQRGSLYHRILENIEGIEPVLFDSDTEGLTALWANKVEAFCAEEKSAYYHLGKLGYTGIKSLGPPVKVVGVYFVVRKGNTELLQLINSGLREIFANGTYDKIYRKWFAADLSPADVEIMVSKAHEASLGAYAPYSNSRVGAAVLTRSGRIYTGANIENSKGVIGSALRVAVLKAVSEGDVEIKAVVSSRPDGSLPAPSADDRQLVCEFGRGILVILELEKGVRQTPMVSELLPFTFDRW